MSERRVNALSAFKIGTLFCVGNDPMRWRVTDVGSRTLLAIKLEHGDDDKWDVGPPYAVAEIPFDEHDLPVLHIVDPGTRR